MLFGGPPTVSSSASSSANAAESNRNAKSFFSIQSPAVERLAGSARRGRASDSTVGEDAVAVTKRTVRSYSPDVNTREMAVRSREQSTRPMESTTTDSVHDEHYRLQARQEFMQDLATVVKAVKASEPPPQPQPIIIQNHATSASASQAQAPPPSDDERRLRRREPESPLLTVLRNIFGSRVNRFFMFSTVGLSFYLFHSWMQHQFRAVEMQKRIDANVVMRMSQWVAGQLDKHSQRSHSSSFF